MSFQALPKLDESLRRGGFDTSILSEVSKDYQLRLMTDRDADAVNELRAAAYLHGDKFQLLDLTPVFWDSDDQAGMVLAIEKGGEVIATMRAEMVADRQAIVQHLDASWPSKLPFNSPVMVLARAATRADSRCLGLNSLLRYCFIKMAMAAGVKQIVGSVYQGASRTNLMASLGYEFYPLENDVDRWAVKAEAPRLISILNLDNRGQRALAALRLKLQNDLLIVRS